MFDRLGNTPVFKARWKLFLTFVFLLFTTPVYTVVSVPRSGNSTRNPLVPGGQIHRSRYKSTCFLVNTHTKGDEAFNRPGDEIYFKDNPPGLHRHLELRAYNYTHYRNPASRPGSWSSYFNRNGYTSSRPTTPRVTQYSHYRPRTGGFYDPTMRTFNQPAMGAFNLQPPVPYYGTQFVPVPNPALQTAGYPAPPMAPPPLSYQNPLNPVVTFNQTYTPSFSQQQAPFSPVQNTAEFDPNNTLNSSPMPNEVAYWNSKRLRERQRLMKYSSFKFYTDVVWWNDDVDDWPGTNKIKPGELYEGIIHYYFTPYDALVLLVDKRVEGSISLSDLPEAFARTTIKDCFKIDHLIRVKLKEPFEFDEKGRPKFIPCLDPVERERKYEYRTRVRGKPIFFTNTMAVFKLEDGQNYAQVFLVNTGVYLTFPVEYKMIEFFKRDELVEIEVLKGPTGPKATGYLCRIPFDTPKGIELSEKYTMIFDAKAKGEEDGADKADAMNGRFGSFTDLRNEASGESGREALRYENEFEKLVPYESERITLRDFVKRIGGDLKVVLGFLALRTKSNTDPSSLVSPTMGKILINFVRAKNIFDIDGRVEDEEFNKFKEHSSSLVNERNPVVAILGAAGDGKSSLFSALCGHDSDAESNFNFGKVNADLPITLFDTPGNELLAPIRDNILRCSDMALIAISAETGVTKKTVESIRACQKLGLPFIFVLTKFDASTQTTVDQVISQLSDLDIQVEQMGGNRQMIVFSNVQDTDTNRENLIQAIILESSVSDSLVSVSREGLKADGYILDSGKSKTLGFYSLLLVKNGELEKGDFLVSNLQKVKVKSLRDGNGKLLDKLGASDLAYVYGFDKESIPDPGTVFQAFKTEEDADKISQVNRVYQSEAEMNMSIHARVDESLREIDQNESEGGKQVPVIVRGDVKALVDSLKIALQGMKSVGVTTTARYKVLEANIGSLTQADVEGMENSGVVVAYNTPLSNTLKSKISKAGIELIAGDDIEDLVARAKSKLDESLGEKKLGRLVGSAEILKIFEASKKRNAAGCVVTFGRIQPFYEVRVVRGNKVLYYGKISSLRRTTDEAEEILETESCGITFHDFNDFKVGDLVEAYVD